MSAVLEAVKQGRPEHLSALLATEPHAADERDEHGTPLLVIATFLATSGGAIPTLRGTPESREVLRVLLAAGADPNAADASGATALHDAARCGHADLIALLRRHGASLHGRLLDADGGTLKVKLAAETASGTLVTRLITDRAAPLQILGALKQRPILLVAAHAEPPAVLQAAAQRTQAQAELAQARSEAYPTLSLQPSFNQYLDNNYDNQNPAIDRTQVGIFLNLEVPIYQGGAISARSRAVFSKFSPFTSSTTTEPAKLRRFGITKPTPLPARVGATIITCGIVVEEMNSALELGAPSLPQTKPLPGACSMSFFLSSALVCQWAEP